MVDGLGRGCHERPRHGEAGEPDGDETGEPGLEQRVRQARPHEGDREAGEDEAVQQAARIRAKTDREQFPLDLLQLRGHGVPLPCS
jgi:hypothetical protein